MGLAFLARKTSTMIDKYETNGPFLSFFSFTPYIRRPIPETAVIKPFPRSASVSIIMKLASLVFCAFAAVAIASPLNTPDDTDAVNTLIRGDFDPALAKREPAEAAKKTKTRHRTKHRAEARLERRAKTKVAATTTSTVTATAPQTTSTGVFCESLSTTECTKANEGCPCEVLGVSLCLTSRDARALLIPL